MKTTHLRTLTGLSLMTALVAGCLADASGRGDNTTDNPYAVGESSVHKMLMKNVGSALFQADSAPAGAHLTYYGGPVVSNIEVYTIFWGGTAAVNYASQINSFYAGVTNSPYFDWLTEYNTPTQTIGRGTFAGSYSYTTGAKGTIDDSAIQTAVLNLIKAGTLPPPDGNIYYAIHFAPGITITQGGDSSCSYFCAYHGTISNSTGKGSAQYVYYGVIPDQGGSCAGGCGNDPSTFNNTTSVSSHEMIETTTDAAVGLATGNSSPLAWYDQTNGEIGDICNAQQGSIVGGDGATYVVQQEFSNALKNCIVSKSGTGGTGGSGGTGGTGGTGGKGGTGGAGGGTTTGTSTSSSTSSSTGSSSGGTCSHPICSSGNKLTSNCDPCAAEICAQDSYCCATKWDSVCVGEVKSICGETCGGGSSSSSTSTSSSSSTSTSSSSSSSSSGGSTCSHAICTSGAKLKSSCDPCAAEICAEDSYCCATKWDSVCVGEVKSICGETCN